MHDVQHYDDEEVEELLALAKVSQPVPHITPTFETAPKDQNDMQQQGAAEAEAYVAGKPSSGADMLSDQPAASPEPAAAAEQEDAVAGPSVSTVRPARNAADIEGDYISVTSDTGERVYCGLSASTSAPITVMPQSRMQGQFLGKSIDEIMQEVGLG